MMRVPLLFLLFCFGLSVPLGGIALGDIDPGFVNKGAPPRSLSYDGRGREMMPPPPERRGITIGMRVALAIQYAEVILQYPLPIAVEWNRWILWSRTLPTESNGSITLPLDWDHLPPSAWDVVLAACANSTLECRLDTPEQKRAREESALRRQRQRREYLCARPFFPVSPWQVLFADSPQRRLWTACERYHADVLDPETESLWNELHVPPKDPWSGRHTVIIRHKRK